MQDLERMGRELQRRGKSGDIEKLARSSAGRAVRSMVDEKALEQAAKSGDGVALQTMLRRVLSTAEGQRLAADIQKLMQK